MLLFKLIKVFQIFWGGNRQYHQFPTLIGFSVIVNGSPIRNLGQLFKIGNNQVMTCMMFTDAISQKLLWGRDSWVVRFKFLKEIILAM